MRTDHKTNGKRRNQTTAPLRRGFTLIELMVVIIIIGLLAVFTITVQRSAVQSTAQGRTERTIKKIDTVVTDLYQSYQYRKVDVDCFLEATTEGAKVQKAANILYWAFYSGDFTSPLTNAEKGNLNNNNYWEDLAKNNSDRADELLQDARYVLRTSLIRELQMMDFPTCYQEAAENADRNVESDLNRIRNYVCKVDGVNAAQSNLWQESPLHDSYSDLTKAYNADQMSDDDVLHLNAELLYLIVTNGDPTTRSSFMTREIGDTNNNSQPEFLDGWGQPIGFSRWMTDTNSSLRQLSSSEWESVKNYKKIQANLAAGLSVTNEEQNFCNNFDSTLLTKYANRYSDPFDPMGLTNSQLVVPMVLSGGADKDLGQTSEELFVCKTYPTQMEEPLTSGDPSEIQEKQAKFKDNITSHNL